MTSSQANNPTHGITLARMLDELLAVYGWEGLAARLDVRCFRVDPSVKSSLAFLRRTPWARERFEALYVAWKSRPADSRPRLFPKRSAD
ncbi:VF530 family protein [Paludibacterium paludis]|uniref:DUF2132 domain-containing protein n=1 Tax=Paludibacterium paludis TaxID=1225769 RepID=A0A918NWJ2_9NEIS|nr:VF530 family protein [Paludibacterium paludis]GGY02389.1 hypothetical protein GCM10011289_00610 [Paludibacterium paludis]